MDIHPTVETLPERSEPPKKCPENEKEKVGSGNPLWLQLCVYI
jgi:hypothetical protein